MNLDAVAVAFALTMHWWIFVVQASTAIFFLAVDRIDVRRLLQAVGRTLSPAPAPQPSPGPDEADR